MPWRRFWPSETMPGGSDCVAGKGYSVQGFLGLLVLVGASSCNREDVEQLCWLLRASKEASG